MTVKPEASEHPLELYKKVVQIPELETIANVIDQSNLSTFAKEGILKGILLLIATQQASLIESLIKKASKAYVEDGFEKVIKFVPVSVLEAELRRVKGEQL